MLEETLDLLKPQVGSHFCDGTAGGGGHSEAILSRSDSKLLALDRDSEAIAQCKARLAPFENRVTIIQSNYSAMTHRLTELDWPKLDGILLDLGVSSHQLDSAKRGFSFKDPGPIDMRMGYDAAEDALELIHRLKADELADIIYQYGEERASRRIARAIKNAYANNQLENTADLARVIARAVGKTSNKKTIHPATKTFQALRIAVNDELGELDRFLETMLNLIKIGGRIVIISFHSLEDRRVKQRFATLSGKKTIDPHSPISILPQGKEEPPQAKLLCRKAIVASNSECDKNPRARSARLRGLERLK